MRLLNAETIELTDFWQDDQIPVYAILSHTWDAEEVTFQEVRDRKTSPSVEQKAGYKKIKIACEQALADGFKYIWIDTCCIDKTSSSELSEAINSMYKWYQNAEVCYAYLIDVSADENAFDDDSTFRKSRWFTRGWTLQELIAPLSVVFYGKNWKEIGTKSSLRVVITEITNIPKQVLLVNHSGEISIATRMSWAANRRTTRVEDIAYCLLGVFGINMPALYGEGEYAFTRLQREIIRTSNDHTIFAWVGKSGGSGGAGLLAKSPADFAKSSELIHRELFAPKSEYSITNVGLSIQLPLQPSGGQNEFKAILNCKEAQGPDKLLGIYLNKDDEQQYVRTRTNEVFTDDMSNLAGYTRQRIYIKEPVPSRFDVMQWMRPRTNYQFLVRKFPTSNPDGFAATEFYPRANEWVEMRRPPNGNVHLLTLSHSGISGGILFQSQSGPYERFVVMLGMHNYNVWCDIVTNITASESLETVAKSYYVSGGRGAALWENRDRLCKHLTLSNKYVFVSARKGVLSSQKQHLVDITITDGSSPNSSIGPDSNLENWMPQAPYRFHVKINPTAHTLYEVIDPISFDSITWTRRNDGSIGLALNHSGISGILVLRDRATGARMAVMLGVHNYRPWSDLVLNIGAQPNAAKDIRDSYYRSGPGNRGYKLWEWQTDFTVEVARQTSVTVKTTEPRKDAFVTEINANQWMFN